MRARLLLVVALLAAAGVFVGWRVGHGPGWFIGRPVGPSTLAAVGHRSDIGFPAEVRVNLTSAPVARIEIAVNGPYVARHVGSAELVVRGESTGPTAVAASPTGFRIGTQDFRGDSLELEAERSPAIWVDDHQYRGRIRFFRQPQGRMIVVNVVPIEDYVASVVDGEMPAAFPEAARQAQAIVARSYVLYQMRNAKGGPFYDVHASTRSQNYLGYQYRGGDGRRYAAETASGRRASQETAGMICVCDGKPFCTYYTAVCGGRTAGGSSVFEDKSPALRPVPCDGCKDAELHRWSHEMPQAAASDQFRRHFASQGKPFASLASIRRTVRTDNVHEAALEVSDGRHRYRLSAAELRRVLPSSWIHSFQFDARLSRGQLVIEGRGHGHGVGLCQWGARGMALAGFGPLEIIRHYYPGAEVVAVK